MSIGDSPLGGTDGKSSTRDSTLPGTPPPSSPLATTCEIGDDRIFRFQWSGTGEDGGRRGGVGEGGGGGAASFCVPPQKGARILDHVKHN